MTAIATLTSLAHPLRAGAVYVAAVARPVPGFFIAHMGGADFFGLVVAALIVAYLFYALVRGEKL